MSDRLMSGVECIINAIQRPCCADNHDAPKLEDEFTKHVPMIPQFYELYEKLMNQELVTVSSDNDNPLSASSAQPAQSE